MRHGVEIPGQFVRPYVQEYLDNYETFDMKVETEDEAYSVRNIRAMSAIDVLAREAQIDPSNLRSFLKGNTKNINFYNADKIFCAMGQPMLWLEWPLFAFYLAVDLDVPPPGWRRCDAVGCIEEFQPDRKTHRFCSEYCEQRTWHVNRKNIDVSELTRTCAAPDCDNTFTVDPTNSQWQKHKYCHRRCSVRHWQQRAREARREEVAA